MEVKIDRIISILVLPMVILLSGYVQAEDSGGRETVVARSDIQTIDREHLIPIVKDALRLRKEQPNLFKGVDGLIVTGLLPEGQGAKAGLKIGNILIGYEGNFLDTREQLNKLTGSRIALQSVHLEYIDNGIPRLIRIKGGQIGVFIERLDIKIIGDIYEKSGQYNQALFYYKKGLKIRRANDDRRRERYDLEKIADVYAALRQYKWALKYYLLAIKVHREFGDFFREGICLNSIGKIYQDGMQYEKALEYFKQGLKNMQDSGESSGVAASLNLIGSVYKNLSQYNQAAQYFERELKIRQETGDFIGEGVCLNNLAIIAEARGQFESSVKYYEQYLEVLPKFGNAANDEYILNITADVYRGLGLYDVALTHYMRLLGIAQESGDWKGEGRAFVNIGDMYKALGEHDKALDYYEFDLKLRQRFEDRVGYGNALRNIGEACDALCQYDKQLNYFFEALKKYRNYGDLSGEAWTLSRIGKLFSDLGQYEESLEYYKQGLDKYREISYRFGEGSTLAQIGDVYNKAGQYQKALKYYRFGMNVAAELGDRQNEAMSLHKIGIVFAKQGRYREALNCQNQVLLMSSVSENPEMLWQVWSAVYENCLNLNKPFSAILAGKQAVNWIQLAQNRCKRIVKSFGKDSSDRIKMLLTSLSELLLEHGRIDNAERVKDMLREEHDSSTCQNNGKTINIAVRVDYTPEEENWLNEYNSARNQMAILGNEFKTFKALKRLGDIDKKRLEQLTIEWEESTRSFLNVVDSLTDYFKTFYDEKSVFK